METRVIIDRLRKFDFYGTFLKSVIPVNIIFYNFVGLKFFCKIICSVDVYFDFNFVDLSGTQMSIF